MNDRAELIQQLAGALEELRNFKPRSRRELARWYRLARRLEQKLTSKDGLSPEVPTLLWHYLADADIRQKDAGYADLQDRKIRLLVRYLKRGEIPSDEQIAKYVNYG